MNYYELTFTLTPFSSDFADILSSDLAEIGFESFVEQDGQLVAYISESLYTPTLLDSLISQWCYDTRIGYSAQLIIAQNWNEEWEKHYFKPILIDNQCVIHSSFHSDIPNVKYDILIDPKMSFGTGHHETTSLMISELLGYPVKNHRFLDMGCGTAVLAILAHKLGAKECLGIDIDEWAYENSQENCRLNDAESINLRLGGAELLAEYDTFDTIFANINRNILLADMRYYVAHLASGGSLFMSGFYVEDIPAIRAEAERLGLRFDHHQEKNRWVAVRFVK